MKKKALIVQNHVRRHLRASNVVMKRNDASTNQRNLFIVETVVLPTYDFIRKL